MAGNELGQFLFTAFGKGMQEKIREHLRPDERGTETESAAAASASGHAHDSESYEEEDQKVRNLTLFSGVMDDFQKLMKQETGIGGRGIVNEGEDRQYRPNEYRPNEYTPKLPKIKNPVSITPIEDIQEFSGLVQYLKPALPTGRTLGHGAFGEVEEMRLGSKTVAGKRFRLALVDGDAKKKFSDECEILAMVNHPNVVAFVGVCLLPNEKVPMILMELMEKNLFTYLTEMGVSYVPKVPILLDIASGLSYIHGLTPPIIHRDLTAKNVLLDANGTAKISDFGNARILDIDPYSSATLTSKPGTADYMPPESSGGSKKYDASLDVFSFGHLALFVAIQANPSPILPYAMNGKLVLELDRRHQFVAKACELLGESHVIVTLFKRCLQDDPHRRPKATELVEKLQNSLKADACPTIAELQCMEIAGDKLEIIKEVAPNWQAFGYQLNFDRSGKQVDVMRTDYPSNAIGGCTAMFQHWLKGNGEKPTSWRTLARLLDTMGYKRLASSLRVLKSIPSGN